MPLPLASNVRRIVTWSVLVALAAPLTALPARGQVQPAVVAQQANAVDAENFDGKDSNEGVYAPESTNAMDQLALAEKMERLKEWNKSADLYQEILTNPHYTSKVVPSHYDQDHRVDQYTSVEELVMRRLAKWPEEGLEVYRARYEAPAVALLEGTYGDDLLVLHQVFSRYFVTDAGKQAGIRLMDHDLENGEFRSAASIGDRLLQWHPNILAERGAVLYRTAIAFHLAGDDVDADARLRQLKRENPQDKGIVRGRDVVLADSLAEELKQKPPAATGLTADSYTTFGGDATRNRILASSGTPGAHLYSVELSRPFWSNITPQQAQLLELRYKEEQRNGLTLGVVPVIDHGALFFQDGQRVYAVSLESGVPLPGWQQSHGGEHNGAYTLAGVTGSPRNHQLTLTVTDRNVLAVMGQTDMGMARVGLPAQEQSRLVCLDRQTGKEDWAVAPGQLPQEPLRALEFNGSPLVVGDNVLVVATASKNAGFEDCYVLCFDLSKGTLRWPCHVATASVAGMVWAGFNPNFQAPTNDTHLAYANGRVYCQTNRGAVAAIDAYNGTIAWLDIYPRGQQAAGNMPFNPMIFQGGQVAQNQTKPWVYNPVIVSQGMVFTLPLEGKNLLIYDAASGAEVKRIDLEDLASRVKNDDIAEREEFNTLAGVVDDKLVVVGNRAVVALNWKTYDASHYDDYKMLFWDGIYPKSLRGRPFLTHDRLYLPMEDRLYMLDLTTGKVIDDYPKYPRNWPDEDEGPGNVLVSSDHTVIAGADRVAVYTDLDAAKLKLDREASDAPNDPIPRLRYAEVMFAAGDYETALAKVDEAIQRLGGPGAMQPGAARDRAFSDALTFAQKLKTDPRPDAAARAEKLFDRAGMAALAPEQLVHYRLARARFDESKGDLGSAVKLYQEILAERAARIVALPDESSKTPTSADIVAQKQIAELMKKDPSVYDPFEKEAADALQKARDAKDPGHLLDVAEAYPNSTVAPQAMLLAAESYEAGGDLRAARRILFDIYSNHNQKTADWPKIIEALARADLQVAGKGAGAVKLLSEGAVDLHDPGLLKPLKLPDGSEIPAGTSFSAATAKIRKFAYQEQARSLPDFHLPVPPPYTKPFQRNGPVIPNVDALAAPVRDFSRPDRLVAWFSAPLLSVFPAGSDKPLASTNQLASRPKGCAWIASDLLVWSNERILLFKGDGPDVVWKLDVGALGPIDVVASEEAPDNIAAAAVDRRAQVEAMMLARRRGAIIGIAARPAPPAAAPPKPNVGPEQFDQLLPAGDRVLVTTTTGRVIALDESGGQITWQTRLTDRPVDRLIGDEDFIVVKAQDDADVRLVVLDTYSGHVRGSRTFLLASGVVPQNVALSPDGTLVYTMPDRIRIKDLYKPWGENEVEKVAPPGQGNFLNLNKPDQLVISEGRILAVSDSGNVDRGGEKYIRLYSLETGETIMLNFAGGPQIERALSVGTKLSDVTLRVIGPRVYAVASDAAICYNLDNPDDRYSMFDHAQPGDGMGAEMCFIGRDHLVLLNPAAAPADANPPALPPGPAAPPQVSRDYTFLGFSRAVRGGRESGRLDYNYPVSDPAGITSDWQPMEGGLAYVSADHKLHLLLGAR